MGTFASHKPGMTLTCPWCGYKGEFEGRKFDLFSWIIFVLLFLCGIIPGVVYAIWLGFQDRCPECKANVPRGPF